MAKFKTKGDTVLVFFNATSEEHLDAVVNVVEERLRQLDEDTCNGEQADDLETAEHAALFNFLCDMEVKGYEI